MAEDRGMSEPRLVVEHREHLWYLLAEAAQLEHMIMCQYLYAGFSLKQDPGEGLDPAQLAAVNDWRKQINGIAVQEMLHLALVANLMTAIGAAPVFGRPNFPQRTNYFPPTVQLDLLPFGAGALTHFLYLERPEGMARVDAEGFTPQVPPFEPVAPSESLPRPQEFATVGHLYRGIADGLKHLAGQLGERGVFVSPARAQANPARFQWPEVIAVTDLDSALAAVEEIIEQGEGARGEWRDAHYGRFLRIWDSYEAMRRGDPGFEPARPVAMAFLRQPLDIAAPQTLITDPDSRAVAEVFDIGYEVLLHLLTRFFTHTDETDEQLDTLVGVAFGVMAEVLRPVGAALTRMPVGSEHPGRTVGPAFEMYYQMGNFVPWRDAAWSLLHERLALLTDRCDRLRSRDRIPAEISAVGEQAAALTARLAAHLAVGADGS